MNQADPITPGGVVEDVDPTPLPVRAQNIALKTPDGFIAFGFGSGLLTRAPGTMGTLAAVPIGIALALLGLTSWVLWLLAFLLGIWLCGRVAQALGVEDYGGIVWDEMVAYWLVVGLLPFHWAWWLAAFALFRGFDILKPWPISLLERYFGGGFGIMIDDIAAAVYALVVLKFVQRMLG
jgi:phosphatidylglycerophosphatase A